MSTIRGRGVCESRYRRARRYAGVSLYKLDHSSRSSWSSWPVSTLESYDRFVLTVFHIFNNFVLVVVFVHSLSIDHSTNYDRIDNRSLDIFAQLFDYQSASSTMERKHCCNQREGWHGKTFSNIQESGIRSTKKFTRRCTIRSTVSHAFNVLFIYIYY